MACMSGFSSRPANISSIQSGIDAPQPWENRLIVVKLATGMMPGTIGAVMPAARARSMKRRTVSVSKAYCVIAAVAPASSLRLRWSRSLWRSPPRDAPRDRRRRRCRNPPRGAARHQFGGVVIAVLGQRLALGQVPAQGDDAADTLVPKILRLRVDLGARGPDAGQMMRHRQAGALPHHPDHFAGARPGAAPGPVGDREIFRPDLGEAARGTGSACQDPHPSWAGTTRTIRRSGDRELARSSIALHFLKNPQVRARP